MQKHAVVVAVWALLGACVIPAQTGPGPQQAAPPPSYAAPTYGPPVAAQGPRASCQQNLQCYGQCNAESCLAACDAQTTPDAAAGSRAVLDCALRNQCGDSECVDRACAGELSRCSGVAPTVAAASPTVPASPTRQPPAPAGQSIGVPELVGGWEHAQSSTQDFVDSSSGAYVGTSVTAYGEHYDIAADGTIDYLFAGFSGGNRARSVEKGRVSFANGNLVVTFPNRRVDSIAERRVMSYFTTTDGTTILVTVPAHTTQAEVKWDDPAYVANFCGPPGKRIERCVGGETWIRSRNR